MPSRASSLIWSRARTKLKKASRKPSQRRRFDLFSQLAPAHVFQALFAFAVDVHDLHIHHPAGRRIIGSQPNLADIADRPNLPFRGLRADVDVKPFAQKLAGIAEVGLGPFDQKTAFAAI